MLASELWLLFSRARTRAALGALAGVPVLLAIAVKLSGGPRGRGEDGPAFLAQVSHNGVIAAKTPLWETWARNAGPSSPRPRGPPDSLTAMASRTGTPARAPRAARVRARLNSSHSSLANIEPLPGQRHEQL